MALKEITEKTSVQVTFVAVLIAAVIGVTIYIADVKAEVRETANRVERHATAIKDLRAEDIDKIDRMARMETKLDTIIRILEK